MQVNERQPSKKHHGHKGHMVGAVFASPIASQDSNVKRIYTLATDQGVQIGLGAHDTNGTPDSMPAYVEQAAIVGPLVCVYAYAPPCKSDTGERMPAEYQCYMLAVAELSKHPALAAFLGVEPRKRGKPSAIDTVRAIVGTELQTIGLSDDVIDRTVRHVAQQASAAGVKDVAAFANTFMQDLYRSIVPQVADMVAQLRDQANA